MFVFVGRMIYATALRHRCNAVALMTQRRRVSCFPHKMRGFVSEKTSTLLTERLLHFFDYSAMVYRRFNCNIRFIYVFASYR